MQLATLMIIDYHIFKKIQYFFIKKAHFLSFFTKNGLIFNHQSVYKSPKRRFLGAV